ncbi:MAG: hypothetical protein LBE70_01880 [Nitrososphaerota archaeon]|nr:hypothetical protein [Nitrososphaerota archaeon]
MKKQMTRKQEITLHDTQTDPNGPLERLFGVANAKILDFLAIHQYDYSKQDIAKYSRVSMRHTLRAIEQLEKLDLIKFTRKVGHSHMYKYNTDSKAATLLDRFMTTISLQECKKIAFQELTEQKQVEEQKTEPQIMIVNA